MAYRKKEEHGTKVKRSGPGKTEINGEACPPDVPHEAVATNGGADSTLPILKNSVALVRTRTIPTERPPPVGEVSANFCG